VVEMVLLVLQIKIPLIRTFALELCAQKVDYDLKRRFCNSVTISVFLALVLMTMLFV